MTADDVLTARLASGRPWICRACGLINAVRILVQSEVPRRLEGLACLCGQRFVTFDPPSARVPFGREAGLWLDEASWPTLQWLHGIALHPWTATAVCERLDCPTTHAMTWSAWYDRRSFLPRPTRDKDKKKRKR